VRRRASLTDPQRHVELQKGRIVTMEADFGNGAIDDQGTHNTVRRQWYANQLTESKA